MAQSQLRTINAGGHCGIQYLVEGVQGIVQYLIYSRGQLSVEQLEAEIKRFWIESENSLELQTELVSLDLHHETFRKIGSSEAITIRVGSSGVDPVTVSLIVVFAPTANRVLKDVWAAVILPRIKRRWGDDAIGRELKNDG